MLKKFPLDTINGTKMPCFLGLGFLGPQPSALGPHSLALGPQN